MRKLLMIVFTCLASSLLANADAGVTGTWSTPKKVQPRMVMEFKATGTTLTGTIRPDGAPEPLEILDGKVVGDHVTFKANISEADGHYVMMFSGRRAGNRITFKCDVEVNPPGEKVALGPACAPKVTVTRTR
jgi:hypothetical protein